MYRTLVIAALIITGSPLTFQTDAPMAGPLARDSDPVIMEGSQLPGLSGLAPNAIVAFRYEAGWVQIPVQVDERALKDYGEVYNSDPVAFTALAYTDPGTYMGSDPDAGFDADDELVLMSKDAGDSRAAGAADPVGVVGGSRVEVKIVDPLTSQDAYVYLFQSDGSLTPDAGTDYVTYSFKLLAGSYLPNYNTMNGPNPEDSDVTTAYYRVHFSDRWIRDEVNVFAGSASGVDILDRHKNLFAPGNCARSENTFSNGEGAFFVNKDGPVRAIRSYMGANSGPLTQRDHFFYERRHDVRTYLRVHAIQGVMDFYDYSPEAAGLVYYNDLNTAGVDIDGNPTQDVVVPGPIVWEMVTGDQGTLVHALSTTTDIPGFVYTSYYLDDSNPSTTQCTGDNAAYGSSGVWVTQPIPNTDPVFTPPPFFSFVSDRVVYAEGPNQSVTLAQQRYDHATNALSGSVVVPTSARAPADVPAYRLAQNYPNPFATNTRIEFSMPAGERASLRIFDVSGRLVNSLGVSNTGGFVSWDGRDLDGRRVASGVYFYQLRTSRFTQTRKMVVLE